MKDQIYLVLMERYAKSTDERGTFADLINEGVAESIENIVERQNGVGGFSEVCQTIAYAWHDQPNNLYARATAIEICNRLGLDLL